MSPDDAPLKSRVAALEDRVDSLDSGKIPAIEAKVETLDDQLHAFDPPGYALRIRELEKLVDNAAKGALWTLKAVLAGGGIALAWRVIGLVAEKAAP